MKETRLREFEEVILLLVGILGEEAYALLIVKEFREQTGKSSSIGAVHAGWSMLLSSGYLCGTSSRDLPIFLYICFHRRTFINSGMIRKNLTLLKVYIVFFN